MAPICRALMLCFWLLVVLSASYHHTLCFCAAAQIKPCHPKHIFQTEGGQLTSKHKILVVNSDTPVSSTFMILSPLSGCPFCCSTSAMASASTVKYLIMLLIVIPPHMFDADSVRTHYKKILFTCYFFHQQLFTSCLPLQSLCKLLDVEI